jgi:hypothetical protein
MPETKAQGSDWRILASNPNGCSEALVLAHGITRDVPAELILDGLASARTERMTAGGKARRILITDAGRVALER